ncbi:ParB/RepB/Spo0J family partition protein [Pseudoflavonifractor sp. AF19-9AC]|nr:ParB/RepB/Spo0J family partition protein [Pseudoflavonifractor sp. AF19-9AC]
MEQAAVDTSPEAAAPEPEVVEPAEPAAGDPAVAEPEPEAPDGDAPPQVDGPEPEQPEVADAAVDEPAVAEPVLEAPGGDTPPQVDISEPEQPEPAEPAAGDSAMVEPEPEPPAPGEEGEVVVSFEQISELISKRNQEARAAIEQEKAATPQPEGMDKSPEEPAQEEPAPKRQNRPPKEKRPEHEEKADKPRRGGRKPKEATQDKDDPSGKVRDKVSRGKRGKAAPERDTPGGGAAAGAPAVEVDTPTADVEAAFGLKDATRATKEEVVYLDLSELHAFKDHPFKVREDTEMQSLVESVKTGGVNQPALVRPREGGGYEIIAGHRRQKASELAGFRNMPCIVREMTDDEAILAMTDDNLRHRDHILPTEKAKALQQQVDAISHRGVKLQNVAKGDIGKRSTEIVGARNGLNYKKVIRLIRLNYLVQELKDMVDGTAMNADGKPAKKIGFTPAVELSYIRPKNQRLIAVSIEGEQASPSVSQAKKLRELDEKGLLNGDVIDGILSEEKKEVDQVIISTEELNKYFGKEVTPRQMKDQIMALLDEWKEKQPPEKKAGLEK